MVGNLKQNKLQVVKREYFIIIAKWYYYARKAESPINPLKNKIQLYKELTCSLSWAIALPGLTWLKAPRVYIEFALFFAVLHQYPDVTTALAKHTLSASFKVFFGGTSFTTR